MTLSANYMEQHNILIASPCPTNHPINIIELYAKRLIVMGEINATEYDQILSMSQQVLAHTTTGEPMNSYTVS